jgi:hypothetical protein
MAAQSRAASSLAKGDMEGYKRQRENYVGQIKSTLKIADRISRGEGDKLTPAEKSELKAWSANKLDETLQAEIESGVFGPRTVQLVRGKAFASSLQFVALRGDFADPDLIDYTHPMYQEFVGVHIPQAKDALQRRQEIAPILGINSFEDAQRLIRQSAAISMLRTQQASAMRANLQGQGAQGSPELPPMAVRPDAPSPEETQAQETQEGLRNAPPANPKWPSTGVHSQGPR